jgi:hypothetical protein
MKTTFTLLIISFLTVATTSLHAQISKGSIALGGNLSFTTGSQKTESEKQNETNILFSPSLLNFYKENKAVGFSLDYGYIKYPASKQNTYGAGIFLRQYKPLGKGFYFFVQEALNYNYSKATWDSLAQQPYQKVTSNTISVVVNPGIAYDISKRFQIELIFLNNLISASYSNGKNEGLNNEVEKDNAFSVGAFLDASQLSYANIGFKIFFGR